MNESSCDRLEGELPLTSANEATAVVDNGTTVAISGFGSVGYPKEVSRALVDHESLTIFSAGSVGNEIDKILVESGTIDRRAHFQAQPAIRNAINAGEVAFFDRHVSPLGDELRFGSGLDVDVAIVEAVAAGEDWFVPSTSIGHIPSIVRAADQLILEVNYAQPLALEAVHDIYERASPPDREPIPLDGPIDRIGNARIGFDFDALAAVVETDTTDDPYTFRDPTAADRAIAANLGSFLESEISSNPMFASSVSMQFGVGSLGNALMGALTEVEFGDREVIYFGEVFQDGLLDMLDSGQLAGASATSLSLSSGSQERFFDGIDQYAEDVVLRPADLSNNPALIERFGVVGVNSAIEVDLYGNANATHVGGTRMISGIGGGGDFVRNSRLSIVALPSTAASGDISRIVPMAPHVDHSEHDISVVVTEHGVADLRGCSPRERATKMIEVADPSFRADLEAYRERGAAAGGQTPHDLETAFDWHIEWGR
jgi:succinyl-CoA:acetate CoA-transferase